MMNSEINQQIEELQTKIAFQEDTIERLSDALAKQQFQLDDLTYKMKHMIERVQQMQPSNIARQEDETPPPHY